MLMWQLLSVMLSAQVVWTLTPVEDRFLTKSLMNYFDDESAEISVEADVSTQQKRAILEDSENDSKSAALLGSPEVKRANHYWTRKRGRETTTIYPYQLYYPGYYPGYGSSYGYNRFRRDAEENNNNAAEQIGDEEEMIQTDQKDKSQEKMSMEKQKPPKGQRGRKGGNKFERRFAPKVQKCCTEESETPMSNQTLLVLKDQCMRDIRKSRKNYTVASDEIEGNAGLYNMFSCDRVMKWRSMVTCSINCVAMKIGVIDADGFINVEVAKRVVSENFAKQKWEQDATDELVEKCAKQVSSSTSQPLNNFGLECSTKPAEFVYCMWREMFLTCPDEKQDHSRQCEKLRTVLKKHNENRFKN